MRWDDSGPRQALPATRGSVALAPDAALSDGSARRRPATRAVYAIGVLSCALLAVLCRLPFLNVPLTNDEGGYAYVARLWAHGAQLYGAAWIDRPQGLVMLFRLFDTIAPGTAGLRLCGAAYVALSTVALAYVGTRLYGRAAGVCAAALYALFASGPQIEGFIVNGELLATLPALLALALLLRSARAARPGWWLVGAGLAAGAAVLVKQSAIDSPTVVLLFAPAVATQTGQGAGGAVRLRFVLSALLGIALALGLSALGGAITGWHDYLSAVVLDNLRYRAFDASANTLSAALLGLGQFWSEDAVVVLLALVALPRIVRERRAMPGLPVPWLAVAAGGVLLGGLFSRHYFVQLVPPLCVLAGAGVTTSVGALRHLRQNQALVAVPLVAVLLAAAAMTVRTDATYYIGSSPVAISQRLYGWPVYTYQSELVAFLRRRVPPGQTFFVAYAAAPLHYLTGRASITRYLWRRPLGTVPGAYAAALAAVEQGIPVCVVPVQPVTQPPGNRQMRAALARRYVAAWRRPGLTVYCRTASRTALAGKDIRRDSTSAG